MTAAFLTPLLVEELKEPDWRLFADLRYQSDVLGRAVIVPAGFVTDFASVPRVPLAYWLTGGTANKPACIHDWLYRACGAPRADGDAVLKEAMQVIGQPAWRCELMYAAVRAFGAQHYCKGNGASSGIGNTRALGLVPPPPVARYLIRPSREWKRAASLLPTNPQTVKEITA